MVRDDLKYTKEHEWVAVDGWPVAGRPMNGQPATNRRGLGYTATAWKEAWSPRMNLADKLVIAISSRVLFDLRESHEIYENQGIGAYSRYQIEHEDQVLAPGEAFPLVRKLLRINDQLPEGKGVEIVLLSRNSADTGLRIFNSIEHHGLPITRAVFCGGRSPYRYVGAFGCHLFLSTHGDDVRSALAHGFAAATLLPSTRAARAAMRIVVLSAPALAQ